MSTNHDLDFATGGSIAANGAGIGLMLPSLCTAVQYAISGTWVGTLTLQGSYDNATWVSLPDVTATSAYTANKTSLVLTSPYQFFRVQATAWTSGIANVVLQPVSNVAASGSSVVTANAGTGFPSVTPAGTSGTSLETIQGSPTGVPVPISAAALPLPAGAATAALQPSLGTAGTPSPNVITTQGVTGMTPFSVSEFIGGTVIGPTNPMPTSSGQFARADKSGTITAGGTAQDVFTAGQATHGFYFQNLSAVAMYIRDDGTAASAGAGSILVPANGGYYESPQLSTPTSKLSVFCATTSSAFTSKVW